MFLLLNPCLSQKDEDLDNLAISLDLSDINNKNGVAIVDKAIQELQKELVGISPESQPISSSQLARVTLSVNSRIRNRNFSSYEIMFSREQNTGSNILLDDKDLSDRKLKLMNENHKASEKSKYPKAKEPLLANVEKGDFVFLKEDGGKHKLRDLYLVLECQGDKVILTKMLHLLNRNAQTKLSSRKIEVHRNDIYNSNIYNDEKLVKGDDMEPNDEETRLLDYKKCKFKTQDMDPNYEEFKYHLPTWSPFIVDSNITSSESSSSEALDDDDDPTRRHSEEESNVENNDEVSDSTAHEVNNNSTEDENRSYNQRGHLNDEGNRLEIQNSYESSEDEHAALFNPENPNPPVFPKLGESILFFDHSSLPLKVTRATITRTFKTVQKRWPGWFNVDKRGFYNGI